MLNLDKIKKINWYRQETEGAPYFIYGPCRGCVGWFKNQGHVIWCCRQKDARCWLDKDLLRALSVKYLQKEKSQPFLAALFRQWDKKIKQKHEILFKKIDSLEIANITGGELLRLNKILASYSYAMWLEFYPDIFDVDAEGLVESELVEKRLTLNNEEKNILMSSPEIIAYSREGRALLKIAREIKETPGALNCFLYIKAPANLHRLKIYPSILSALERHQSQYFWLQNSWGHTKVLQIFDFVENIKNILVGGRAIASELESLDNYETKLASRKKALAKKYGMSDWLRRMFNFFGLLAYWRDERKVQMQKLNHYLELIGTEIAKRSGLTWDEIKVCDPLGIGHLPVGRRLISKYNKFFAERHVIIWDGHKPINLSKRDSERVFAEAERTIASAVTEIRGNIACPGKVRGEVIVISKVDDFFKMKAGAILVAPMTRPEYVPLMKMAAAIVTDEGGVTCHAAVVSRELKIPCIIGTQNASRMLKDGDKVLVNANHGVVIVE